MDELTTETAWTAGELLDQFRRRQKLFVLDVRNREEFERFPLEGPALSAINLPYFEMLEAGGKDDMVDCIVACVERNFADQLPKDSPVLAVCAQGDTSEYVMQGLQRLGYNAGSLNGGMKAWGNYYESQAITDTPELGIFQISRPARGCLSYMVVGEGKAIVIDPLRHLHSYTELARARNCAITTVIDTHSHADHISGGLALAAVTGAVYHLHPYDGIHPIDMLPATFSYEPVRDGQVFDVGQHELRIMHIPCHTLGLVALILDGAAGQHVFYILGSQRVEERNRVRRQIPVSENDGDDVAGFQPRASGFENELFRSRRQDAALDDERQECFFARRPDLDRSRNGRPHDCLRDVARCFGH